MAESTSDPALLSLAEPLLRLMREQLQLHNDLRACIEGKREAIRTANLQALTEVASRERAIIRRVQELEAARLRIMKTAAVPGAGPGPASLKETAAVMPPPARDELLSLQRELRSAVEVVRRESSIVRRAVEELGRHVGGLMLTVQSALSRAGVYGRRGEVESAAPVPTSVDLTT